MKQTFFALLALTVTQSLALPTLYNEGRSLFGRQNPPGTHTNILLFDAPAYPDPKNPMQTIAALKTYVYTSISAHPAWNTIPVPGPHPEFDFKAAHPSRKKLFLSRGIGGIEVQVSVSGCSSVKLPATHPSGDPEGRLGLASADMPLGFCEVQSKADTPRHATIRGSNDVNALVYPSPNSGWGIISDVDDTVKVTQVLHPLRVLVNTFIAKPQAVANMPELYSALAESLETPLFLYISGSPYQLYPFIREFIHNAYPKAMGPIFVQDVTATSPRDVLDFMAHNLAKTVQHKQVTIQRAHNMYPAKKWLAVGDSTQQDPEIYARMYQDPQMKGTIACIWIRKVEDAENSPERFKKAFAGVPADKWLVFEDSETLDMMKINVQGGKCK